MNSTMTLPPSDRTRVRRMAENARYDRATVHAILDAAYLCHLAFVDAKGPHCLPMACWREGNQVYIHGSNGGRLVKHLAGGAPVCLTVTHLDGLVLARSAFNHSMNYRSLVVYGQFVPVSDDAHKRALLDRFMRHLAPGREHEARPGHAKELAATTVLGLSLAEAACKVREGGPFDDDDDLHLPVWTGVLPLALTRGAPQPDPACKLPAPAYVTAWTAGA